MPQPPRLLHRRARGGARPRACSWSGSRWCRSSAWCAATSPARAGRTTRRTGAVCGIELPRGAARSPSSCPSRSSRPPPRPRWATTTRTSTSTAPPRSWATGRCSRSCAGSRSSSTRSAAEHARERGIILADTKFEFGRRRRRHDRARRRGAHARLLALLAGRRLRAGPRPAVVRQAVRARLGLAARAGTRRRPRRRCPTTWSRAPAPRYIEAYERITGEPFDAWLERCGRDEGARADPPQGGHPRPAGPGGGAGAARARLRGRVGGARRPAGGARGARTPRGWPRCASGCSPTR